MSKLYLNEAADTISPSHDEHGFILPFQGGRFRLTEELDIMDTGVVDAHVTESAFYLGKVPNKTRVGNHHIYRLPASVKDDVKKEFILPIISEKPITVGFLYALTVKPLPYLDDVLLSGKLKVKWEKEILSSENFDWYTEEEVPFNIGVTTLQAVPAPVEASWDPVNKTLVQLTDGETIIEGDNRDSVLVKTTGESLAMVNRASLVAMAKGVRTVSDEEYKFLDGDGQNDALENLVPVSHKEDLDEDEDTGGITPPPVVNIKPIAQMLVTVNDLTVSVSDMSSDPDGTIASRVIDFGDGNFAIDKVQAEHTYATEGEYEIYLRVVDDKGLASDPVKKVITATAPANPPPPARNYKNIVFIGSSITNGAFGQSLSTPDADATSYLESLGVTGVKVYGYGFPGSTTNSMIDTGRLQAMYDAFPDNDTLFHYHLGGNDVTPKAPIGTASSAELNKMQEVVDALAAVIEPRKEDTIVAPLTFRVYTPECRTNPELSTGPFNDNYYSQIYQPWTLNTDGRPVADWYNIGATNQAHLTSDGIHWSKEGYRMLTRRALDRLAWMFKGEHMPEPMTNGTLVEPPRNAHGYMLNFGYSEINTKLAKSGDYTGSTITLPRNDFQGPSITWTADMIKGTKAFIKIYNTYCGRDFDYTVDCDPFYADAVHIPGGTEVVNRFEGLEPNVMYEFHVSGFRLSENTRIGIFSERSNPSNFVELATSVEPTAVKLNVMSDANGMVEVLHSVKAGCDFSHIGGIMIVKA